MTNFKEKVIHGLESATHKIEEITHKIEEIGHKISDHFLPIREKIENHLKEKNINGTVEVRQGKDSFNVLAHSDGSFVISNDSSLSRILLNQALFSEDGEKRLSNAMTIETNPILRHVNLPPKKMSAVKISQLTNI